MRGSWRLLRPLPSIGRPGLDAKVTRLRQHGHLPTLLVGSGAARSFASSGARGGDDPRIKDLGREISSDYAQLREHYSSPRYPLVLAHGLLGFSELALPGINISYWHGISPALKSNSIQHITTAVPPSHSIEVRAEALAKGILAQTDGPVNIIAHSMGGLDARYMISCLRPKGIEVKSLVTVATPHRGSAFADWVLGGSHEDGDEISEKGWWKLQDLYGVFEKVGLGTEAFAQLTRKHMSEFNPRVPDLNAVRYFSYGAATDTPPLMSPFRHSHRIVRQAEGPNDGLVSVGSSRWGTYKGTLVDVSHLDLINWSNRVKWTLRRWMGRERGFNAVAFYLDIADMLAKEGL